MRVPWTSRSSNQSILKEINPEYSLERLMLKLKLQYRIIFIVKLSSFKFSSVSRSCPTPCDPMDYSMPGLPVHHQLLSSLKLMSIESVMPSNHLICCRPLLLPPSIFLSIRVFANESALHIRWTKYWSFASTSVLSMNIQD